MFKNTFQSGFLSILYSIGSRPLEIWDKSGEQRPPPDPPLRPLHLQYTRSHHVGFCYRPGKYPLYHQQPSVLA